ncbi:hypothetical protein [Anaplasma phagocytophilum]|uniref:hypothetical protein n=1 Tax=Anaplasma phagocytophilum TaxID=948 RepID=UPI0007DEDAEF|nr:hypothetical protein [Anaplasma phagocytophilum]SBO30634.1 hypothetical protein ANAPC3_00264 [Anaplasma phagocytophilum]SBO30792.1 hypothetical protein ANAPC2_00401 [Anaplasma phagocytophilum]SBO31657.1 hypothetical protein ANAPC4_00548 [Anaplasma phagocytophilum]SCV63308.1 hypothetical protein ANAPC5_00528 [Anaplasma phagocytophilum]
MRNFGIGKTKAYLSGIIGNIIKGKIKESFFDFTVVCSRDPRVFSLLSILPCAVLKNDSGEYVVKIKKSDLVRLIYRMRNPMRYACNEDEYSMRLATYMLLELTNLFEGYAENLYQHAQSTFVHDMRSGAGRFQQLINYIGDLHPGRLPCNILASGVVPLCFPNPNILESAFSLSEPDMRYLLENISENTEDSILFEAAKMRLGHLGELRDAKKGHASYVEGAICCIRNLLSALSSRGQCSTRPESLKIAACDFMVAIREIMSDVSVRSHVEKRLRSRQLDCVVNSMKRVFYDAKGGDVGRIDDNPHVTDADTEKVLSAIAHLESFRSLIDDPAFFQRFNDERGVLQAQQYFRGLSAMVAAESVFLSEHVGKLTEEDLRLFLNETCKEVSGDVSQLLAIYDFLATNQIVDRDAVVRVTRGEIQELSHRVHRFVSMYRAICQELSTGVCKSLEDVAAKITCSTAGKFLDEWEKSLLNKRNLEAIFTVDEHGAWTSNDSARNRLLLSKIESHKLCDILHGLQCEGDVQVSRLVNALFVDGVTSDGVFEILRTAIKNRKHEWIRDIEYSSLLDFVTRVHKGSRYIPFHSWWRSLFNPGKYRTYPSYKGKSIRDRLYAKDSLIPHTEFSSRIASALYLKEGDYRNVTGAYDAEMLHKAFRVHYNISGAQERLLYYLKKYRVIWYVLLILVGLACVLVGVVGRLLAHFGIIPGIAAHGCAYVLRAMFDSIVAVLVLDTIVDKTICFAVQFIGLVIRTVDFILLFGLVSRITRFAFDKFYGLCSYIYKQFVDACSHLSIYGLKHSLFLLVDRLFHVGQNNLQDVYRVDVVEKSAPELLTLGSDSVCMVEKNITGGDSVVFERHGNNAVDDSAYHREVRTPASNIFELISGVYKEHHGNLRNMPLGIYQGFVRSVYGDKEDVSLLLEAFKKRVSLPQSTIFCSNYIDLRREFFFLMNNYQEHLQVSVNTPKTPTIFNSYSERRAVYDIITAVNMQTVLVANREHTRVESISSSKCAKEFLSRAHAKVGEEVTLKEINEKIAAVNWAIAVMAERDVSGAVEKWEILFQDTKIEKSCAIALMDCALTLREYRHLLLEGIRVSREVVLCDLRSNFRPYIRDACCILDTIDKGGARHSTMSYRRFCDIMCKDFSLLEHASSMAEKASSMVGLNLGVISLGEKVREEVVEFLEYFQNPKSITLSILVYSAIKCHGGSLAARVDYYSKSADIVLNSAGLGQVYDFFMDTELAQEFLECFWGSLFPKECVLYMIALGEAIVHLDGEGIADLSASIDRSIYGQSFHKQSFAVSEVKAFFNCIADLCCTVSQVHLIKSIKKRKKKKVCAESLEFYLQQEEDNCEGAHACSASSNSSTDVACDEQLSVLQSAEVLCLFPSSKTERDVRCFI